MRWSYQGFNYQYNNKIVPRLPPPKMLQIFSFFVNPKIQCTSQVLGLKKPNKQLKQFISKSNEIYNCIYTIKNNFSPRPAKNSVDLFSMPVFMVDKIF